MPVPRNPYIAGKALSGVRGFAGREDVFQLVQTVLGQSETNAIVLFGQRRIGKTSILLNLKERLPSPPFVSVFFDLQDRARKPLGEVLFELAQTIAQELGLPPPDRARFDDSGAGFREVFLPAVYRALGEELRLVLLFDEFDVLDARQEEQLPETSAARAFIPAMRRLINEEPRLGFIFVVGRKADELSIEFMSAFKTARFHRISVLDPESAHYLVLTAQRGGTLQFAQGAPERIFSLTAGHPYLTQLLCQLLFEQAYTRSEAAKDASGTPLPPLMTLADVEAIVPKALEAGEHIFEWIWDGLPPAERVIFSAVAAGTDEQSVITEERLLDVLQTQGIRILIRELELAPRTLVDWQMLRTADGGYQFYVELMRRWVADRKPLPRVREELDRINPLADMLYQTATGFYRSAPLDSTALDKAVGQLQTALNVNPNHLKARLLLADIYKIQGNHDGAVRELAEAYRIDQDGARLAYENALLQQAEAYEKTGHFEDAITTYGRVMEVSPNNRNAQERKAQAELAARRVAIEADSAQAAEYERAERWEDAIDLYRRLISLSDDPRWQEALARAERERSLAQRYADGLTLASEIRWAEAQQAFGDVVAVRPGYKLAEGKLAVAAEESRKQQAKTLRDARYALDHRLGRLTFLLAWISTGTIGWLLLAAMAAIGLLVARKAPVGDPTAGGVLLAVLAIAIVPILQDRSFRKLRENWNLTRSPQLNAFASRSGAESFRWSALAGLFVALPVGMVIAEVTSAHSGTTEALVTVVVCVALVLGIPASLIQWERLRGFERARRWLTVSVAGRAAGIGAGYAIALAIWSRYSNTLPSWDHALLELFALSSGAALWGVISGAAGGAVLTGLLAKEQSRQLAAQPNKALAASDRVLQTCLPIATGLAAIVGLAAGLGWLARPPSGVVYEVGRGFPVERVSFAPSGDHFVTAGSSNVVRVWDPANSRAAPMIIGNARPMNSAAFSPDGKTIVTAFDDNTARVWDAATGQELRRLSGHTSAVHSAAFSPDGKTIVTAYHYDKTARLWDAATGQELRQLQGHTGYVYSAAYSPDGNTIVTASADNTARVWDAATGQELRQLQGHTDYVRSAAFSPDGKTIVTASDDKTARVWDAATGQELRQLQGHTGYVYSAAYSPDGVTIVTTSGDGTARLWDAASGVEKWGINGHTAAVRSAAYSPDGRTIVTASEDKTARLWNAAGGEQLRQLRGNTGAVNSAVFSPDGKTLVTASADMAARLWDAATGQELRQFRGHNGAVYSAAFSPDGVTIVTASADKTARLWDAASGQELRQLLGHTAAVWSAAYSPDGTTIVTASADKTARVWDAASGQELRQLQGHTGYVYFAAYSPDGRTIVTASEDKTARLWDAAGGQELRQFQGHAAEVNSAAFSPDGNWIVTALRDGTARLYAVRVAQLPSAP